MDTFDLWGLRNNLMIAEEKDVVDEFCYAITVTGSGEWFGEGNFCGWYSNEWLENVEVWGYTNEDYSEIVWFDKVKIIDRLSILSIAWGGNKADLNIFEIEALKK